MQPINLTYMRSVIAILIVFSLGFFLNIILGVFYFDNKVEYFVFGVFKTTRVGFILVYSFSFLLICYSLFLRVRSLKRGTKNNLK